MILVYAEQNKGKLLRTAHEATSLGHEISRKLGTSAEAVVIGAVPGCEKELAKFGISKCYLADHPELNSYSGELYIDAVLKACSKSHPKIIIFPATVNGKDLAARVSAKLSAPLATDCTEVTVSGNDIHIKRPMYAGRVIASVGFRRYPVLISIRPHVFHADEQEPVEPHMERIEVDMSLRRTHVVKVITESRKMDVSEADIVVCGGRGMKSAENYNLLEELAELLGGAVGSSRAVVDAGWRPHSEQIGQTGKIITPKIYMCFGVSGAIQHLVGILSSMVIVAVNRDADAPIFKVADYGIVGDLFEVLPALISEIRKLKGK